MKRHSTIDKVAAILEAVAAVSDGITFTDLVRAVGAPKSSVYNFVQGLLAVGYLADDAGRYTIGPGVELLVAPLSRDSIRRVAHDELRALSDLTEETAQLCVRSGDNIVVIDQVQSPHDIRYVVQLRARRPLATTSMGKVFLADLDERSLRRYLDHADVANPGQLLRELTQVRSRDVAFNEGQSVRDVCAVGAPVRRDSVVVAAVGVAGPMNRMSPRLESYAEAVSAAAARVSAALGHGNGQHA